LGTQVAQDTLYHPQSGGKTKIGNKFLEGRLHYFSFYKQSQWVKLLPFAKWWYNTFYHTSSKMSLFMGLYGYRPTSITSTLRGKPMVQVMKDHIQHLQDIIHLLKDNLAIEKIR
jgi:hypothetical protein